MDSQELRLPLFMDTGDGKVISPITTLIISKGMDSDGDICYAVALGEGTDIVDALALVHYARIDIEGRVREIVAPDQQED